MKWFEYVAEQTGTGFSAYIPDLPGCVSTGESLDDLTKNLHESIVVHLDLPLDEMIGLSRWTAFEQNVPFYHASACPSVNADVQWASSSFLQAQFATA